MGSKGIVASSAALGVLLQDGIGDTIRVSLTPEPGGDRTLEVRVAQEILQTMGLSHLRAAGCGLPRLRAHHLHGVSGAGARHPGSHPRAPCRSGARNIPASRRSMSRSWAASSTAPANRNTPTSAFSLPGTGESPAAPVFIDGQKAMTLRGRGHRRRIHEDRRRLCRAALRRGGQGGGVTGFPLDWSGKRHAFRRPLTLPSPRERERGFPNLSRRLPPLPACGERVGVRGLGHESRAEHPEPNGLPGDRMSGPRASRLATGCASLEARGPGARGPWGGASHPPEHPARLEAGLGRSAQHDLLAAARAFRRGEEDAVVETGVHADRREQQFCPLASSSSIFLSSSSFVACTRG